MQGIIASLISQQMQYTKSFISGCLVGGVTAGFIGYGFGLMRGEQRHTNALNHRIKMINEEKIREIDAINARVRNNISTKNIN
jgi:hypothetical protein